MNLKTLLRNIGELGKSQKLVEFSAAGTSLEQINGMEIAWYPLLFSSPTGTHTVAQNTTTFEITLYYIDRLLPDYSNDLDIFSSSIENLKNIINGIKDLPGVLEVEDSYSIRNFTNTEKMNDSLAGAYAQLSIKVANDSVCYVEEGEEPEPIDYSKEYFTIETLEDGTFYVRNANIGYSVNGGEWDTTTGATSLSLNQGDAVRFKGTAGGNGLFSGNTLAFDAYGNIESLEYGDDYIGQTTIKNSQSLGAFGYMFSGCTGTRNAENLILPATTLNSNCYFALFDGCTSITTAPELPATTLAKGCYSKMFRNCTSLTEAPELPATALTRNCYYYMFWGCKSLTTAPELPATTLGENCYYQMFMNCTSLTEAPELQATTLANGCYYEMFHACTSLTTAPELPATTLANTCYQGMFQGCTSLTYVKCLATNISANSCTNWLRYVSQSGTFVKAASMEGWTRGKSGIPDEWTIVDA